MPCLRQFSNGIYIDGQFESIASKKLAFAEAQSVFFIVISKQCMVQEFR